jgi:hypothetical protein
MWDTCVLTVVADTKSSAAIAGFDIPLARSRQALRRAVEPMAATERRVFP